MDPDMDPRSVEARSELEGSLPKDLPVDFDAIFPRLTGWGAAKANRKRLDLLNKLAPVLRPALEPGETVQWLTQGTVNLGWEQLMMGLWANLVNRTGMVLTNERLLLIHLSGKEPAMYVNQVRRSALKKSAGLFSLVIKLGSGKIILSGVSGADKKTLKGLLGKNAGAAGGKEYLCPTCYVPHEKFVLVCNNCQEQFKSPFVAALRSWFFPGLGDYYLGHHGLAVMEMLGSLFIWSGAIFVIYESYLEKAVVGGAIGALLTVAVINMFDAAMTHAQARKGLQALDGRLGTRAPGVSD